MSNIQISIEDFPEATIIMAKNGKIRALNLIASKRFGANCEIGKFAPWLENNHGWNIREIDNGEIIGTFRPDADETARAKTMLFATLSHEIRTPLNGILGMAGLLGLSELNPAQRSYLQAVEDSGQHLLGLLNDILDYAKLESGKIELESIEFDPLHTLQSIAEICSPKAHEKGLEIAVCASGPIPRKVRGDDGRLRQIILNLTSNAVKFTPDGGVILRIKSISNGVLRIQVEDTGIGVPENKTKSIFDEFAQADSSHTREYGGTGLGLAIVKKLANAMSGDVAIMAREGGGTIFYVEIPFEIVEPSINYSNKFNGKKIGIATNSDTLFDAIKTNLSSFKSVVNKVENFKNLSDFDVILLDAEYAKNEQQEFFNQNIPIVALIGQEHRELIEQYREKGIFAYLIKPLRIGSLFERIGLALEDSINENRIDIVANDERANPKQSHIGTRVLLAEDNRINALLAKSLLERNGCDVVCVANGEEALEAVKTTPYDLVFMDFHMPIMDGLEASRKIRSLGGEYNHLPIIALTAAAMEEDRRQCIAAGMDDFITKPLDANALSNILTKWAKPVQNSFKIKNHA
ncbi:MAG: response regulator [Caulobacterales bacterium]|nr:response regulator [Caulobacterales bacterium]MCA0373982.1 response regulator [Pseudomonadota bacterium]